MVIENKQPSELKQQCQGRIWELFLCFFGQILEHQARKRKDAAVKDDAQAEEEEDWIFNFNLEDTI